MSETHPAPETQHAQDLRSLEARRSERLAEARAHAGVQARLHARSRLCGGLRLLLFAAGVSLAVARGRGADGGTLAGAATAAVLFFFVVALHGRVQRAEERARRRRKLAEEGAARLAGGTGPGAGAGLPPHPISELHAGLATYRTEDEAHELAPWALEDLGVEGGLPSLFARLDTAQSAFGSRRLRYLLRHPLLDAAAIRERQECIDELAQDGALRDALLLAFFGWRGAPLERVPAFLRLGRVLPRGAFHSGVLAAGLLTPVTLALAWIQPLFLPLAVASSAAALALNLAARRRGPALRDAYLELEPIVQLALDIAPLLRQPKARSARLAALGGVFEACTAAKSPHRLQHLSRCLRLMHLHEIGFLYGVVQLLTLWDLQWLLLLESALKRDGEFEHLVGALADLEAYAALAVFAAEQPGLQMPEILDESAPRLEIRDGEHPLLRCGQAVPNDLELGGDMRLVLVTGSNMAGKSTFLRMVLLNALLAQVGAPVRAARMRLVPLRLHANINVRDSLADGKSYFLVEIERVRSILEAAAAERRVLAVFDELFRGTNSTERLAASREIARHLAASGGLFLVATHDLELLRLVTDEVVPGIAALHFRDEIVEGHMVFPYRARAGVTAAHNALRLLELSGYPADLVRRAREHAAGHGPGG